MLDIRLKFSLQEFELLIPVLIEPERIGIIGAAGGVEVPDVVPRLVARGLRGQLKSGSLLTGGLYVDLDFHPDAPPAKLEAHGDYRVLPRVPAPLDALANTANDVLDTLQALPLEEIGKDLRDTVKGGEGARELGGAHPLHRRAGAGPQAAAADGPFPGRRCRARAERGPAAGAPDTQGGGGRRVAGLRALPGAQADADGVVLGRAIHPGHDGLPGGTSRGLDQGEGGL